MRRLKKCQFNRARGRCAEPDVFSEASAWENIGTGWRPLFGNVRGLGFSFEWHDFSTDQELNWARSFHPNALELCLNLDGNATLTDSSQTVELGPRANIFYFNGRPALRATRRSGDRHRFLTVEYAPEFLEKHLEDQVRHLHPCVKSVVENRGCRSSLSIPAPMSGNLIRLMESLQQCPVFKPAQETWFRCKALELAAQSFFSPEEGELFCSRQQRVACERSAKVQEILESRLADPPTLEELGKLVGCSSFYLSRQFTQATGLTIQQFLRKARLEKAAELLLAGKHNVTEAALEVGYNSLSHFTATFRDFFGCCPGLYPLSVSGKASESQPGALGAKRSL